MNGRTIIACKLRAKNQPGTGLLTAIAEEVGGKLIPVSENNFCPTLQVFVVSKYDEIDQRFRYGEYFKVPIEEMVPSNAQNEQVTGLCIYKTSGLFAEKIQSNEYVDIIEADLPDRNDRTLDLRIPPATPYVMIKNAAGDCFGPVEWEDKSQRDGDCIIELKFITGGGLGRAGRTKQINRNTFDVIKKHVTEVRTPVGNKFVLENVVSVATSSGFEDYASDADILEYVKSLAGDSAGKTVDRKTWSLLASRAGASRDSNSPFARRRIEMFNEIVSASSDSLDRMNDVFENVLRSELGTRVIEGHIEEHRARYMGRLKAETDAENAESLRKHQDEMARLREEIDLRKKETVELSDKIEEKRRVLREDIESDQQTYLAKVSAKVQESIDSLNTEEASARERLEQTRSQLKVLEDLSNIKSETEKSRHLQEYFKEQAEELRRDHANIREELHRDKNELRKKLLLTKPYTDILNGSFDTEEGDLPVVQVASNAIDVKNPIPAQRAIVDAVSSKLKAAGRHFTDIEIANLLVTTQQSFITFFAGLPGVGKTSLCTLFAEAQGLSNRIQVVPVARGWTSIRDIVGFHNPLSDKFQPAPTGLYGYLRALSEEQQDRHQSPMSYVLLDEANLSSIEHYWSVFMGMTDSLSNHRINLGRDTLTLPSGLRFLATINYDGTTEPLSHRVLDRASVIVMQPGDIANMESAVAEAAQALPVSVEAMDTLFGRYKEAPELESHEKVALSAILSTLQNNPSEMGRSIPVSQRKLHAIHQYCARAGALMRSSGNEMTAFDLAIRQHILPQVRGTNMKFGARLAELKKVFDANGLELSSEYLSKMIVAGRDDLHSYDFFCW